MVLADNSRRRSASARKVWARRFLRSAADRVFCIASALVELGWHQGLFWFIGVIGRPVCGIINVTFISHVVPRQFFLRDIIAVLIVQGYGKHSGFDGRIIIRKIVPIIFWNHLLTPLVMSINAPAWELFDKVSVTRREGVQPARQYSDYVVNVETELPEGVDCIRMR